ncbi:malonic semialdehyde reductase [Hoeflea sp.]|uniref:malonic semialdehyde reductase n=1 Tax=Hoeflea sp. TaxID=1940281 RepID=UPI003B02E1C4
MIHPAKPPQDAPTGEHLEKLRSEAQDHVRQLRQRINRLGHDEISLILSGARSHYAWTDRPVTDETLRELYDIVKMGATSMNSSPARFVFVRSPEGREKLMKSLKPTNVAKVATAPVTVIIAHDLEFWKHLPFLFPHEDRRPHFEGKPEHAADTAYRNATLQGAYLMIAARALGLDVGAMSGFSNAIVDEEFFAGTTLRSNFLCNLGYADEGALFHKLPRFDFDDVCSFA